MSDAIVVLDRFRRVYIGDSVVKHIEFDLESFQCNLLLDAASLLKDVEVPSIFDPEQRYSPACLAFKSVKRLSWPEGDYYFNNTIVEFSAAPYKDLVEFKLVLTGGLTNESFMRSFVILAEDFSLR